MLIGSAERYYRRPVAISVKAKAPRQRQPLSPLPYLAVASTYGLLFVAVIEPWTEPVSGLAIGALLVTALVVARQLLAVRENVRLLAETAVRQNEARFRSLVQHSSDVIIVTKTDGSMRFVSPSAARVFGYDPFELVGQDLTGLLHPEDQARAADFFKEATASPGVTGPVEWRFRQSDGSWLHAELLATNLLNDPTVRGIVLNTRDVSERKRLEQQLTHQAFHDPLTGLANRALFRDRVSHALALAQREGRADHGALPRPRRLQEGQRQPRPRRRRPAADRRGGAVPARAPAPPTRWPASAATSSPSSSSTSPAADGHVRTPRAPDGGDGAPVHAERQPDPGRAPASAWPRPPGDETADDLLRNADVAMYARQAQAARAGRRRTSRGCTPTCGAAGDGGRAQDRDRAVRAHSPLPADRQSRDAGRSTASRRCSAGTIRNTACSCRSTSFRWPRRRG